MQQRVYLYRRCCVGSAHHAVALELLAQERDQLAKFGVARQLRACTCACVCVCVRVLGGAESAGDCRLVASYCFS